MNLKSLQNLLGIASPTHKLDEIHIHQVVKKSKETWFKRVAHLLQSPTLDQGTLDQLEEVLISSDIGVSTAAQLIARLKLHARASDLRSSDSLYRGLKEALLELLEINNIHESSIDAPSTIPHPYVILMAGVNGSGKTTSVAKLAYYLNRSGKKVILGAADTFRAGASEQLQVLGDRIGIPVISHGSGADPGAVAYDAFQASTARGADVLIVDTAGRLHNQSHLMEELKKIQRVLKRLDPTSPHQILLTLDASTGQNGLVQARHFTEAVECTGIFLAKLDGTSKGGIVLSIAKELHLPVLFVGTGEGLDDMAPFDPRQFVEALLDPFQ